MLQGVKPLPTVNVPERAPVGAISQKGRIAWHMKVQKEKHVLLFCLGSKTQIVAYVYTYMHVYILFIFVLSVSVYTCTTIS